MGALLECVHLEDLSVNGIPIQEDEVDQFFQVCKEIKRLGMSNKMSRITVIVMSLIIFSSQTLHNTLVGSIWKHIFVADDSGFPWEALQNNKEHIEELHLFINLPGDCRSLKGCTRLNRVSYDIPTRSSISNDLLNLIKAHRSTITNFSFMYGYSGLGRYQRHYWDAPTLES
ncbi:hypothetical protein BCR41DRAFT_401193 [Lobosporangium transversale]|uniref:Uncharacterized protein n=1 Tax=Lobosporangium transversale TaxID=64571 RepID=A0A1Y2G8M0_9FUNG|nr:hypothetical protein BCR41DRAFT_401193 [Lobosporangium transversale]ORZ04335.1 hypothetical protein BCR41DRAFT_401193 [Lobosporangium transversale]|eukprot:XP_021876493.1 hypothetical protein BCR41DRAFT_401193 [Lobosporangium transversale]